MRVAHNVKVAISLAALTGSMLSLQVIAPTARDGCGSSGIISNCPQNDGDRVIIGGEHTTPGSDSGGSGNSGGSGSRPIQHGGSGGGSTPPLSLEGGPAPDFYENVCPFPEPGGTDYPLHCVFPSPSEPEEEEDPIVIPPVTASDVVSFAPATGSITTEPDGVAVVGRAMNVIVPASEHSSRGALFDLPVTVRFSPVELAIDYGDGTSVTAAAESATWAALGQTDFTATSTSHAYSARGRYTITAHIRYAAVADFGPYGAIPVDGLVSSPPATTTVQAVTVHTGLVQHTCLENPTGAGC